MTTPQTIIPVTSNDVWGKTTNDNLIALKTTADGVTQAVAAIGSVGSSTTYPSYYPIQTATGVQLQITAVPDSTQATGFRLVATAQGVTVNTPPGAPVVTATPGNGQVTLSWPLVSNAASYQPYVSTGALIVGTAFGSPVTGTSVTVTGLTNGTLYYFAVVANNVGATLRTGSNNVTATPAASGTPVIPTPAAPGSITVKPDDTFNTISWGTVAGATSYSLVLETSAGSSSGVMSLIGTSSDQSGYSTTVTPTKPTGAAPGNIGVWAVTVYNGVTVATPTGWTLPTNGYNDNGSSCATYVFYRVFDGTEGSSFTATASAVGQISSGMEVWSGPNGTPIDVAMPSWASGSGLSVATGTKTAVTAGDTVVIVTSQGRSNGTMTWGTGITADVESGGGALYTTTSMAHATGGAIGSTLGSYVGTYSATATSQSNFLALRPTTTGTPASGTVIYTGTTPQYKHTGLTDGTTYTYHVYATNSAAATPNSPNSVSASGTPAAPVIVPVNPTGPTGGTTAFSSVPIGVYRSNGYSNAPLAAGVAAAGHKSVADYEAWLGAPKNSVRALVFIDNYNDASLQSQYNNQAGLQEIQSNWLPTGRKLIIGGCLQPIKGDNYQMLASGKYDAYWTSFATILQNGSPDAYLRPCHEWDGQVFPASQYAIADPTNYKLAWQRAYGIVHAIAPNVKFCWNPTGDAWADYRGTTLVDQFYPGDAYVDAIGIDIYDHYAPNATNNISGATATSPWTTAQQEANWIITGQQLNSAIAYAKAHNKPLWIPEWGFRLWDSSAGGDNANYINHMVSVITNASNNIQFHAFWEDPGDGYGENGGRGIFDPDTNPARPSGWKTPNGRAAWKTAYGNGSVGIAP